VSDLYERLQKRIEDEATGINYWVNANPFEDATRAVLELHKPQLFYLSGGSVGRTPLCFGCEINGYDAEHAEFPCETVRAIARALDVQLEEK